MTWTNPPKQIWKLLCQYRVWVAWTCGALFALRLLSLGASCLLDTSQTCSDWFRYGILGPLRFQWVFKYKELIAGLLAVGGGAFAYFAATATISANERRAEDERDRNVQGAVARVLKAVSDVMHALNDPDPMQRDVSAKLTSAADALCQVSFRAFGLIMLNVSRIERKTFELADRKARKKTRDSDPAVKPIRDQVIAGVFLITSFFTSSALPNDPGDTLIGQLPGKEVIELMRSQKLPEPDPNEALTAMFDFSR